MATKKYLELQEMTDADLQGELNAAQSEYQRMEFDHAIKGLENPLTLREMRRDIARLKTEARRREMLKMSPEEIASRSKIRARRRRG